MPRGQRRPRGERGFATTEFVAAFGFLMIPTLLLVISLMSWPERQAMANTAASEAAREVVVKRSPNETDREAVALAVARETAEQFVDGGANSVTRASVVVQNCTRTNCRGAEVTVEVDVQLPMLSVPFIGTIAPTYTYTARATERVEDYRGF